MSAMSGYFVGRVFNMSKGTWNDSSFDSLNSFTKAALKHQGSEHHIMSVIYILKHLVNVQLDKQRKQEISIHNEKVRRNRDILKRLTDCVFFLGQQELSFRGQDESGDSLNRGNYLKLLMLLAEHDADLWQPQFAGTSGKMQGDLINAVGEVLNDHIKEEIKQTKFVVVMIDEMTDLSNSAAFKCPQVRD